MFQHLIEAARDFGYNFQLTSIHLDFEDASNAKQNLKN
jgi:hypothetical protein